MERITPSIMPVKPRIPDMVTLVRLSNLLRFDSEFPELKGTTTENEILIICQDHNFSDRLIRKFSKTPRRPGDIISSGSFIAIELFDEINYSIKHYIKEWENEWIEMYRDILADLISNNDLTLKERAFFTLYPHIQERCLETRGASYYGLSSYHQLNCEYTNDLMYNDIEDDGEY